nr:hypothetical protein [Anaerolineae bacterium]
MRVLHPVQPQEMLICRGTYSYHVSGQATGDVETWLITQLPDGTQIVRADIDGSRGSGSNLVTQMRRYPDGKPEWLRIRYRRGGINAAAQYSFEEAGVRVARQAEGYSRRVKLVEIAADYVVDYHPVIAHDYVWRGYPDNAGGEGRSIPVFSPDLWAAGENILQGRALRFHIMPQARSRCVTPARTVPEAQHYAITMNDGTEALAWFDSEGIPVRWTYPAKQLDFLLTEYQQAGPR